MNLSEKVNFWKIARECIWFNLNKRLVEVKMQGHKVGYVDQNIRRQLDGIELDRFFVDKASGKNTARPKFQEMLSYVREGDMIVVH